LASTVEHKEMLEQSITQCKELRPKPKPKLSKQMNFVNTNKLEPVVAQ
jgi:hypothetical protein